MLYDPKWEVKADPFSLESLIAWLEKQPADGVYDYCSPRTCLVAQYLRASGVDNYEISINELRALGWIDIVNPMIYVNTFGAALDRARAASSMPDHRDGGAQSQTVIVP